MIKLENYEVVGWDHAIRGMRNPKNSWERSDSEFCESNGNCDECSNFSNCNPNFEPYFKRFWEGRDIGCDFAVGPNDHELMLKLAKGGSVHAKYRRMITVYVDITAPLYWWKEFDTYKVGTVANSCSTMHKIHEKEFTLDDFSCEHLISEDDEMMMIYLEKLGEEMNTRGYINSPKDDLEYDIEKLNLYREAFLRYKNSNMSDEGKRQYMLKKYWQQMIQRLPSSYNQKRTVMLNYEVLTNIYNSRKNHKLNEWVEFCKWIEQLPYSEIITGERENGGKINE